MLSQRCIWRFKLSLLNTKNLTNFVYNTEVVRSSESLNISDTIYGVPRRRTLIFQLCCLIKTNHIKRDVSVFMFLGLLPLWSLWVFIMPDPITIKPCICLLHLTVYERLWSNNEVSRTHVNNQECFNDVITSVSSEIAPLNSVTKKTI